MIILLLSGVYESSENIIQHESSHSLLNDRSVTSDSGRKFLEDGHRNILAIFNEIKSRMKKMETRLVDDCPVIGKDQNDDDHDDLISDHADIVHDDDAEDEINQGSEQSKNLSFLNDALFCWFISNILYKFFLFITFQILADICYVGRKSSIM